MTRGQVSAMLAAEGFALGSVGVLAGLVLGFVIALILIHVVNRQSFHWSMDVAVPWGPLRHPAALTRAFPFRCPARAGRADLARSPESSSSRW